MPANAHPGHEQYHTHPTRKMVHRVSARGRGLQLETTLAHAEGVVGAPVHVQSTSAVQRTAAVCVGGREDAGATQSARTRKSSPTGVKGPVRAARSEFASHLYSQHPVLPCVTLGH